MSEIQIGELSFQVSAMGADSFKVEVVGHGAGISTRVSAHDMRRLAGRMWTEANRGKPKPTPEQVDEFVTAGLRAMANKYHPDRGGSGEAMANVNNLAEWIREELKR